MSITLAVSAILSLALSIACLRMAGDAEKFRGRWMDLLGMMELDMDHAQRKSLERQFSLVLTLFFVLLLAFSGSCFYWTVVEVNESRREKTTIERELEMGRLEVEKMRQRFSR